MDMWMKVQMSMGIGVEGTANNENSDDIGKVGCALSHEKLCMKLNPKKIIDFYNTAILYQWRYKCFNYNTNPSKNLKEKRDTIHKEQIIRGWTLQGDSPGGVQYPSRL